MACDLLMCSINLDLLLIILFWPFWSRDIWFKVLFRYCSWFSRTLGLGYKEGRASGISWSVGKSSGEIHRGPLCGRVGTSGKSLFGVNKIMKKIFNFWILINIEIIWGNGWKLKQKLKEKLEVKLNTFKKTVKFIHF
jgi:hypothetical protein